MPVIYISKHWKAVRIRYRIDGVLYEKASYDIRLLNAITARIKIIGGMDISEKETTGWTNYPCGRPCGIRYPCINPANGFWREEFWACWGGLSLAQKKALTKG